MLKNRLIPTILCIKGNNIVQSVNFKHTNIVGNAITAIDFYNNWAVDEIIILDVSRTEEYREKFHKTIEGLSKRCFVPLTVGGWIKDTSEIQRFLKEGADKISINSQAYLNPELIKESSKIFGSQCIVVSIDVKKNSQGGHDVIINQGRTNTGIDVVDWAKKAEELGAGEIFLTSIDTDGTKEGYDLDLIKKVSSNTSIPVVAFGGVGKWEHFVDGILEGKADAVSAGNIFHYTEQSTYEAKNFMVNSGLNVRVPIFYKIPSKRNPKYTHEGSTGHF
jgi:cyclase